MHEKNWKCSVEWIFAWDDRYTFLSLCAGKAEADMQVQSWQRRKTYFQRLKRWRLNSPLPLYTFKTREEKILLMLDTTILHPTDPRIFLLPYVMMSSVF